MKQIAFLPALPAVALAKAGVLLTLFTLLLFTGCGDDKKQIEALTNETETIHDEAMKDLADMNRVARDLKQTLTVATMTPEQSAVYTETLAAIGKAENEMMDWMKNYKSTDGMSTADAMKYLQEQKTLIEKNRADINAAKEAGMKLQGK
ncbi:MAG: hypothetical protein Q7T20_18990 [Saprospiraceae bacterium]|nr:hypothetical protein [Saprospiraceae bacterium]